jgi:DNA-binding response OmpR family regulator
MQGIRRVLFVAPQVPDDVTRRTLEIRGFDPTFTNDWQKAWNHLAESEFSLVVADVDRNESAIRFIRKLRQRSNLPILVVGKWGTGAPTLALSQGADAFERLPIQAERLAASIERLLTRSVVTAGQTE